MIFIIDTNIVFSGLLRKGATREILITAPFTFIAPENMIGEIRKYENQILKRTGFSKEDFEILFSLLTENITIVNKGKYETYLKEAEDLLGEDILGDIPFLALALSTPNNGIWTDDKHFERQDKIKVWKTFEVIKETEKFPSFL
jgi:predicted nucleic acid-binding protein